MSESSKQGLFCRAKRSCQHCCGKSLDSG